MGRKEAAATHAALDADFVEARRLQLEALRSELVEAIASADAEERATQEAAAGEPRDSGEDAEHMAEIERDHAVRQLHQRRLQAVERALQKIADGNYGWSEQSGEPIPRARLEAMPDAALTIEEVSAREQGQRSGER